MDRGEAGVWVPNTGTQGASDVTPPDRVVEDGETKGLVALINAQI